MGIRKRPPRRKPGSRIISAEDYQRMLTGDLNTSGYKEVAKLLVEEIQNADPNTIKKIDDLWKGKT